MITNIASLIEKVTEEIKDFTDIAVIGMSGGADSTLVTILCTIALGAKNVYGYGMPYDETDRETFNTRSRNFAANLAINYCDIPVYNPVLSVITTLGRGLSSLNVGNIKSRMRMVYLYTLCADIAENTRLRCRVIGTGNLSEDYIGYDTKGGDALADIFPIGSLFKSEVYQLLDYLVEKHYLEDYMIDRVPSAGLEDGQTDEDDLGYTYDEMEPVIRFALGEVVSGPIPHLDILNFVNDRHEANKHKHEAIPVIDLSEFKV